MKKLALLTAILFAATASHAAEPTAQQAKKAPSAKEIAQQNTPTAKELSQTEPAAGKAKKAKKAKIAKAAPAAAPAPAGHGKLFANQIGRPTQIGKDFSARANKKAQPVVIQAPAKKAPAKAAKAHKKAAAKKTTTTTTTTKKVETK